MLSVILPAVAATCFAHPAALDREVGRRALPWLPPDLARQVVRHERDFASGAAAATRWPRSFHQPGGRSGLEVTIQTQCERLAAAIRDRAPFAEVVAGLGSLAHLTADLNAPFLTAHTSDRHAQAFAVYVPTAAPRIPLVFYGLNRPVISGSRQRHPDDAGVESASTHRISPSTSARTLTGSADLRPGACWTTVRRASVRPRCFSTTPPPTSQTWCPGSGSTPAALCRTSRPSRKRSSSGRESLNPVKPRSLVSVSDKRGLDGFARGLVELGFEIVSTGGTAQALRASGIPVVEVSELTGTPEVLGGRVKTLHPRVFAAILADIDDAGHRAVLEEWGLGPISLVAVNLYPFVATAARPGVAPQEVIENIDIGGPSLLRAAAKNHRHVTVVVDPDDYAAVARRAARGRAGRAASDASSPSRRSGTPPPTTSPSPRCCRPTWASSPASSSRVWHRGSRPRRFRCATARTLTSARCSRARAMRVALRPSSSSRARSSPSTTSWTRTPRGVWCTTCPRPGWPSSSTAGRAAPASGRRPPPPTCAPWRATPYRRSAG